MPSVEGSDRPEASEKLHCFEGTGGGIIRVPLAISPGSASRLDMAPAVARDLNAGAPEAQRRQFPCLIIPDANIGAGVIRDTCDALMVVIAHMESAADQRAFLRSGDQDTYPHPIMTVLWAEHERFISRRRELTFPPPLLAQE
jgi:hypothetical protein